MSANRQKARDQQSPALAFTEQDMLKMAFDSPQECFKDVDMPRLLLTTEKEPSILISRNDCGGSSSQVWWIEGTTQP